MMASTAGCSAGSTSTTDSTASDSTIDTIAVLPATATPRYKEEWRPTPNWKRGAVNTVEGVVLHHTAEPTAESAIDVLQNSPRHVGTHVVIDTDGTRYLMCKPEQVTYHAGKSSLNGRDSCNNFTVGIEFQGNTLEAPLTQDQILSAIEYLAPLIEKYNIPMSNIVTHEMVRDNWNKAHPDRIEGRKIDITPAEYEHFMTHMRKYYARRGKTTTK